MNWRSRRVGRMRWCLAATGVWERAAAPHRLLLSVSGGSVCPADGAPAAPTAEWRQGRHATWLPPTPGLRDSGSRPRRSSCQLSSVRVRRHPIQSAKSPDLVLTAAEELITLCICFLSQNHDQPSYATPALRCKQTLTDKSPWRASGMIR